MLVNFWSDMQGAQIRVFNTKYTWCSWNESMTQTVVKAKKSKPKLQNSLGLQLLVEHYQKYLQENYLFSILLWFYYKNYSRLMFQFQDYFLIVQLKCYSPGKDKTDCTDSKEYTTEDS